jgi:hypothetical protein
MQYDSSILLKSSAPIHNHYQIRLATYITKEQQAVVFVCTHSQKRTREKHRKPRVIGTQPEQRLFYNNATLHNIL